VQQDRSGTITGRHPSVANDLDTESSIYLVTDNVVTKWSALAALSNGERACVIRKASV